MAEEERGKRTATVTNRQRQDARAAVQAFQAAVVPVLQEVHDWLRSQAITAKVYEEHLPPRFRMARLLVWPPRCNMPEAAAPYVAFRFDLEAGEISCAMLLRDDYVGEPRPPAGTCWPSKDVNRDVVRDAVYAFLQQLFTIHK